ncbi:ShlB/FhaC/HecB family hemolysin secretion/activation protein [Pectobacterium brasiliense]|uniref:ShlB/FhaC/HecB family hemolysin secretion/activation protein n=2 Tax=Pectobacterium brasiliense TaxID=180957 RepID=A0A3S1FHW0_9GAMM|nr:MULTISPECIES: ShlB/FhaC/HecB family hemolysin secretion/activation protein [Pectobacterium]GKW28953.1 peptide transporter [Pectobacterium carotovorum subsp. carotovorum]MBN3048146.1 ShlB/FhaC/HecB family hemolysin secretion/activation protein [Pectobacterium brasiliense]MBN3074636.1 ShlB/FhaC/HecB family hemolysin secretion/activation protein [Pectobacterium brasiliense]MBN3084684.1 ShlB/FhaC/HecB family hemolysin secretion/activation protein [Pectobacterium brasiliense]MBN3090750.1 ShlB/Fh
MRGFFRLIFIMPALFSYTVFSASLNPADRNDIQQRQAEVIDQSRQQRDALLQLNQPQTTINPNGRSDAGHCFFIKDITYHNSSLLREKDKNRLNKDYINRCLNVNDINQLIHDVSNWYIERGYITSRAFIAEQDLSGSVLQIDILEGRLESINLNNQSTWALKQVFPGLEGKILNLRDIEQGMEQLNRMPTQQVSIEIQPGSQPGYSIVNLTSKKQIPLTANIGFDNSGQKSTGERQLSGGLWADNVLGLADQWFVNGGHSSEFRDSRNVESLQAGVSLPYGYWTLSYDYSQSRYRNDFINRDFLWHSTGDSQTHRATLSRVVFRNGDMKTSLSAGLSHRIGKNYLNDVLLQISSRKLSSAIIGINHSQKLWGGLATLNPAYSRGTRWFGAESDEGKSDDAFRAEFNKVTLAASYYYPIADNLHYLTNLYGQYSPQRLYGSEQVTLGGETSVRGFKEQYLSGNRGGYWRNELNWRAAQLPLLGSVTLTAAVDGGHLFSHQAESESAGTLWGTAVGAGVANQYLSQQITVGWPLAHPDWLKPDSAVVYYRVGLSF